MQNLPTIEKIKSLSLEAVQSLYQSIDANGYSTLENDETENKEILSDILIENFIGLNKIYDINDVSGIDRSLTKMDCYKILRNVKKSNGKITTELIKEEITRYTN